MLISELPLLIAMGVLAFGSAFFSASEAALFFLRPSDRRVLRSSTAAGRLADSLLDDPDRLLSAVLFWNLVINMVYFALAAQVALDLQKELGVGSETIAFSVFSLLALIVVSEMLPKSLAVFATQRVSTWVSIPLAISVRLIDPLMPTLSTINELSRRVMWPKFKSEPYLRTEDLDRAIEYSSADAQLIEQERTILHNLVQLSEIRVDEWMRPRSLFEAFRPPVMLSALKQNWPPSEYLLVTEEDSEEVIAAIDLKDLFDVPDEHLERLARPVVVLPWCATVADTFDEMRRQDRQVTVVINEYGETIGILTFDDVLDTIFRAPADRSGKLWNRSLVKPVAPGVWHVTGMTSLRRLASELEITPPPVKSRTVTGCIWESLQRIAVQGDEVEWGPFLFRVLEAPAHGLLLAELRLRGRESTR